jgi:Rad3-related DNA helicase
MFVNENLFPFPKMREQQKEITKKLQAMGDPKYIIIQAGTGTGKSPFGIMLGRNAGSCFYLTGTHVLEKQIVDDFSNLSFGNVHGKANYRCSRNGGMTSSECGPCLASQEVKQDCMKRHMCEYYELREKCVNSQIFCTNYDFLFRAADCAGWVKPRKMMILDEAHDLEDKLVSFADIDINPEKLLDDNFEKEEITPEIQAICQHPPRSDATNQEVYDWMKKMHSIVISPKWQATQDKLKELAGCYDDIKKVTQLVATHKRHYKLDKLYRKMQILDSTPLSNWIFTCADDKVHAVPLDVSWVFHQFIEPLAEKFVFMSATIFDKNSFCRAVGIPPSDTAFIDMDSTFDPAKSPIYCVGGHKLDFASLKDEDNLEKLAQSVKFICDRHPNDKGIIHTGNFTITAALRKRLGKDKRYLFRFEDVKNDEIIAKHNDSNKPTILVSSSLMEGVSLDDDLARFQIIIKFPWLSLGDARVKAKSGLDPDWYAVAAWRRIVQASGRGTRSEEDACDTFILDNSFGFQFKKAKDKKWLPGQFCARLKFGK